MCGIAGFQTTRPETGLAETARRMSDRLAHRGPDSHGLWCDEEAGIALAHRRLSILELTAAGHQPMLSASGRYVLSFNGEIYNHLALRDELARDGLRRPWNGRSDTETLLAAFEAWRPEQVLQRVVGMFAFAIWDRDSREWILARDRLGEKPLYYGWAGGAFAFASELKALRTHGAFNGGIDRGALARYLQHNYVPGTRSIIQGIRKLPPGHFLRASAGRVSAEPLPYWPAREVFARRRADPVRMDFDGAMAALDAQLREAIAGQMVADVPLGAFLSGGVDSSLVVALMQAQSSQPVRTFTIGFAEPGFNEAAHAARVAAHLGTQHTELYLSPTQAMELIPRLPSIYDEPFADTSQIPTILVSELARRSVKVSLSGDGADELFCGYARYFNAVRSWQALQRCPRPVGRWLGALAGRIRRRERGPGGRADKFLRVLAHAARPDALRLYRELGSQWQDPARLVIDGGLTPVETPATDRGMTRDAAFEQMMLHDTTGYLPDDILCKLDRAAMSVSLETRVPYLDHRVVEFAWSLPMEFKAHRGTGKRILRALLARHLPAALFARPKQGFVVPIGSWLRGPLRPWAADLLAESSLRRDGFLDSRAIRRIWTEHTEGGKDHGNRLWGVLMFQAWLYHAATVR